VAKAVADGILREDLFYRLNVIPITLPPLRERREDIPLLAAHFVRKISAELGKAVKAVSPEALAILENYRWPGNIRELENVIERAVALETHEAVLAERLPEALLADGAGALAPAAAAPAIGDGFNLDEHLRTIELDLVRKALEQEGWSRTEASRRLGVTPRSLRYLMREHGLSDPPISDKN